jgi:hypothetical protein
MEKKNTPRRSIKLAKNFHEAWQSLCRKSVELETDAGTPFVARAKFARRRDSSTTEVLVFLRNDGDGKLKECSRCYMEDWGYYFNHLGKDGQRVGMYLKAVDLLG